MPAPSTSLKASCALLLAGTQCGTGFLVSADRLFTCAHVIKDAGDGPIVATFSHGRYEAVVDLVDAQNDCALLLLKQPVPARDAQPLAIATDPIPRSGEWLGYGFPAVAGSAGLLIDGRGASEQQSRMHQDPRWLRGTPVHQERPCGQPNFWPLAHFCATRRRPETRRRREEAALGLE